MGRNTQNCKILNGPTEVSIFLYFNPLYFRVTPFSLKHSTTHRFNGRKWEITASSACETSGNSITWQQDFVSPVGHSGHTDFMTFLCHVGW